MSYSGRSLEHQKAKRNEKVEAQLMEFQSETDHWQDWTTGQVYILAEKPLSFCPCSENLNGI